METNTKSEKPWSNYILPNTSGSLKVKETEWKQWKALIRQHAYSSSSLKAIEF